MNVEVVTAKSITSNCTNSKSICNTKRFQTCSSCTGTVRSRYVKFICGENPQNRRYQREREPSRIPGKKICRLLTKSRKFRKVFRKKIKRNIPDSSCVYRYTQAFSHKCQRVLNYKCFDQFIKTKLNWKTPIDCKVRKKKRQQFYNNVVKAYVQRFEPQPHGKLLQTYSVWRH